MHVLGCHTVAWQIDHLTGIDVPPCAQCCRSVEECYRLADPPGAGQDRELIRHRSGLDVMQHVDPKSEIMRSSPLQSRMVLGPGGRVLPARDGSPPRVRVREALAALIVPHFPSLSTEP